MTIGQIMALGPVIPVLVIDDITHAVPIAQALVTGGLPVLEVTLRTSCTLDAIRAMSAVEGAIVGAGTVLDPRDLDAACDAGARFIVSPGLTDPLGKRASEIGIPFLPGTASASDIMRGIDMGFTHFKFFPGATNGGVPALKSLTAVFRGVRFCPTGGVTLKTAPDWLAIPEVLCVGGSWLVPPDRPDVVAITAAATEAAAL